MSQQFNSPFFVRQLVEYVQKRIGRSLKQDELTYARDFVQEHVPKRMYLNNIQLAQSARQLGDVLARIVSTHTGQREVVDVHEMLRDILSRDGEGPIDSERFSGVPEKRVSVAAEKCLSAETPQDLSAELQPFAGYGCLHLVLNSAASINPDDLTTHRWDVFNVGGPDFGRVSYSGDLWSIVSVRAGSFDIPEPLPSRLRPVQIYLDEFYLSISEIASQGFYTSLVSNIIQFPFLREDSDTVFFGRRRLTSLSQNKGLFDMDRPLTLLNQITLRFIVQSTPLELPPSCFLEAGVRFDEASEQVILVIPQLLDPTYEPYAPIVGDGLVFGKLLSTSLNPDNQSGGVSSREGVSVIAVISQNRFLLDIAWIPGWVDAELIYERVCMPKYTWRIPLTFIYRRRAEDFNPR